MTMELRTQRRKLQLNVKISNIISGMIAIDQLKVYEYFRKTTGKTIY